MAYNAGPWQPCAQYSPVTDFFMLRHFARAIHQDIENLREKMAKAGRQASWIDDSPFNRHRKKMMSDYITSLADLQRHHRKTQRRYGRLIIDLASRIDAVTTMDQRLELLNCNLADRAELTEPNIGLIELISVHCVEDSAAHRADEFNDRPLHSAVWAEIIGSMRDTPEGRAASARFMDEALAPGGLLYGVRTGHLQPDGTLKLQAPALVLHDASGSRVIERTPS